MTSFDLQPLQGMLGNGDSGAAAGQGGFDPAAFAQQLQLPDVGALAKGLGGERTLRRGTESPIDFGGALAAAIERVDGLQQDVGNQVQALASGQPVALHDIMMSMGKSEVAFNLMLEVRNKLVDAWEKLSRSVV